MQLRILPKIRKIPKNPSKTFVLFSYELQDKIAGTFEEKESEWAPVTLDLVQGKMGNNRHQNKWKQRNNRNEGINDGHQCYGTCRQGKVTQQVIHP